MDIVGALLDNVMTFASTLLNQGNISAHIECNHKTFASASFFIEDRSAGRVLSLSPSVIPSVTGIVVSAVLFDVPRPLSCVFGQFIVDVESFKNSTVICITPVLPVGKFAFRVLHSLGSSLATEALVVAPPQVKSVDHPSFGILNRYVEFSVSLQSDIYSCNEISCFFSGHLVILSDQCTCQVLSNSSISTFELIWRNISIFEKSISVRAVPRILSFGQQIQGKSISVFGSNFDHSCLCSFNGMLSFALSVNDTDMRCALPEGKLDIFDFSVVCNGVTSESVKLHPSLKGESSFSVESFANAIDGSTSCANVVGVQLHAIKRAYLCNEAADFALNNASQILNVCVPGRHRSCHLQLFDHEGSILYSDVVNSSSIGALIISPSVFVSQSWISITIVAVNLRGSSTQEAVKVSQHTSSGSPYKALLITVLIWHGQPFSGYALKLVAMPAMVRGIHQKSQRHFKRIRHFVGVELKRHVWRNQGHHRRDIKG
jgi:hypothetical protein